MLCAGMVIWWLGVGWWLGWFCLWFALRFVEGLYLGFGAFGIVGLWLLFGDCFGLYNVVPVWWYCVLFAILGCLSCWYGCAVLVAVLVCW